MSLIPSHRSLRFRSRRRIRRHSGWQATMDVNERLQQLTQEWTKSDSRNEKEMPGPINLAQLRVSGSSLMQKYFASEAVASVACKTGFP